MATSSSIAGLSERGGQREIVISRVYDGQQNLDLERVEWQHASRVCFKYCIQIIFSLPGL